MAKLIYNIELGLFYLIESDRDNTLNKEGTISNRRRCVFHSPNRDIDQNYKLLALFGIDDINLHNCKRLSGDLRDNLIISESVNPYIMKINWRCVVYFGEDMPVVKNKTVKTKTNHYQLWTGNTIYKKPEPETYFYVDVKERNKLFFFYSCCYDFINGERLTEFNEKNDEFVVPCLNRENFDYIARLDYTDEDFNRLLNEKIVRERQERIKEQRRLEKIEKRKQTDGFCDICGEPAEYVADPFQRECGYVVMRWLCRDCYDSILGDI